MCNEYFTLFNANMRWIFKDFVLFEYHSGLYIMQ